MCPLNSQGYPDRYAPSKQRIRLEKTTTRNKQTNKQQQQQQLSLGFVINRVSTVFRFQLVPSCYLSCSCPSLYQSCMALKH